jgi:hypothetical protein
MARPTSISAVRQYDCKAGAFVDGAFGADDPLVVVHNLIAEGGADAVAGVIAFMA